MKDFQPTPAMIQAASLLLIAMAYHELIKPTVEAYQQKVLRECQFQVGDQWVAQGEEGKVVLDDNIVYLLSDIDAATVFSRYDQERDKAGFGLDKPGDCPLLIAKNTVIQAKNLLIEEMYPVTEVTLDTLFCQANGLDKYNEYINLTLNLLAPFCDPIPVLLKITTPK